MFLKTRFAFFIFFFLLLRVCSSQNLNAKVIINYDLMPVSIERRIFSNMQNDITSFLNDTKWSNDVYDINEKIYCSFILNLENYVGDNTFLGSLNIIASRPVYNSVYLASTLNLTDREVAFQYTEGQSLLFNEFRIQSNNPLSDNLTAIFAYYAFMIVGLDNNSFKNKSGYNFFQKAINIANNAPEHRYINGWNSSQSRRNRYWLADAVVNVNNNDIHNIYYLYYREGLDNMTTEPQNARNKILKALSLLRTLVTENPQNLAVTPLFMQGKTNELIRIFKNEPNEVKEYLLDILQKIDPFNYTKIQREIQKD